jgi:hypothetical protein
MSVAPPFHVTAADIARSSLERADFGAWALLVCGCYHLFDTEDAARRAYRLLSQGVAGPVARARTPVRRTSSDEAVRRRVLFKKASSQFP